MKFPYINTTGSYSSSAWHRCECEERKRQLRQDPTTHTFERPNYDEGDFIFHARLSLKYGMGVTRGDGDNKTSLLLGIVKWETGRSVTRTRQNGRDKTGAKV